MAQQHLDARQTLPFGIKRNRLAEFLASDVLVAAGSATLVTPAVMIFDRLVVEKSTNNQPLLPAFRRHLWFSITQPATFLASRPSLLVWGLYAATFTTANTSETIFNQVFPKLDHATVGTTSFISTFLVNTSFGIWKDVKFAELFGHNSTTTTTTRTTTSTSTSDAPSQPKPNTSSTKTTPPPISSASKIARSVSRSIPLATYSAFLFRDGLTIFGSFNLPAMLSPYIPDSIASCEYLKILIAHLGIPAFIQLFNTPIHLLGLDLYNRQAPLPPKDRMNRVSRDWIGASLLRMCRIIPAFGLGGFVNAEGRAFLHQKLGE